MRERIIILKKVVKGMGMNLDKQIDISPSTMSSVINGGQNPGHKMIESLVRNCVHPRTGQRLNPYWLFGESEEMWSKQEKSKDILSALQRILEDNVQQEINNAILSCSDYYREVLQISQKCLHVEALLHSGKRDIGIKQAEEVLMSSEKLELIEISLRLSRELANHYAVIEPDKTKFKKYKVKVSKYERNLSDELAAHMAYIKLGMIARTGSKVVEFESIYLDVNRRSENNSNYRFRLFYYMMKSLYYKLKGDKVTVRNICEEALEFFRNRALEIMPFTVVFSFYFDLIPSLIEEKNYVLAETYLFRSIGEIPEGTYNYHLALLLFAMLGFASRKKGLVGDALRKGEKMDFESDDISGCWGVVTEGYGIWEDAVGYEERIFSLLYKK